MKVGLMPMNSPHAFLESGKAYSIILNLLGVNPADIQVGVDSSERELGVLAKKSNSLMEKGLFWIFNVPKDGRLDNVSTRFQSGVLEISIPRRGSRP